MSNTSPITLWLDHLLDLLPPKAIRLVGAGNGSGIWAQWLAAHGQVAATLVEANPQQFAALQRQQAAGNWGQASLLNTVIAPSAGKVDFFTASLATESGLLPPEELRALWPNVHTVATHPQSATDLAALLQLGTEPSADQQWLLLDCLPAAALLRSAQAQLLHVDVVVARVLQAVDSIPSLSGMGVSLEDVTKALPGFRLLALQPGRHPALAHALFVRDYRSVAHQLQADLEAQLTQAQAEKANLLKKQEQLTKAQQALQADLAQITKARDAEATARQAVQQAQTELHAQLVQCQTEKAKLIEEQAQKLAVLQLNFENLQLQSKERNDLEKIFQKQTEEIKKLINCFSTKSDVNNVVKQLQSFIGIENYWKYGELPTVNTEQHGWPVSPDFSLCIITLLEQNDYDFIVEFGSGVSTIVIAKALKKMEKRRVGRSSVDFLSFDHLPKFYEQTLEMLHQAKLHNYAKLSHAPLRDWISSDNKVYSYYECEQFLNSFVEKYNKNNVKILIVVDGPPGNTGPYARYPALPFILNFFENAELHFLLDDYIREEEKGVVKLWKEDLKKTGKNFLITERKLEKEACLIKVK